MAKSNVSFLFLTVLALSLIGCGGNASADDGCEVPPPPSPSGCEASPYEWRDEVLFVCPGPLPFTEMNGLAFVQVGNFQFVNYNTTWVNSITRVCFKNVGPTSLDTATQINFVTSLSAQETILQSPWPRDGKVCADIVITVGAESVQGLAVYINSFPRDLPTGAQYQFALEAPTDITVRNVAVESIVGDFPVKAEMVTITAD